MNATMGHRGPDGRGRFWEPGVGLGHVRLAILDLSSTAAQPMATPDGTCVLTYNGEVYNFRELRRELVAEGASFRSGGDTEVLLNGLLRYGPAYLQRVNGMFALAFLDRRSGDLLLARDGLGVKPLYYAQMEAGFLFASELKALLCCRDVERSPDPQALLNHLTYLWCPAPMTSMRGVRKLEPGSALLVRDGRIRRQWCFYRLPLSPGPGASDADASICAVRGAVMEAVRRQLVSDVPVGAFLSGGLDSSAVVACARAVEPECRPPCFTIALDDRGARREGIVNDLPYAETAARHLGVELHRIAVGPEMADELPLMLYHLDEPQADAAPLNVLYIARLARDHGIKVLLSGAGGDDVFSGYRRHRALRLERWWRWMPAAMRRAAARAARSLPASPPALRKLVRGLRDMDLDGDARIAAYFHWLEWSRAAPLLAPDVRAQVARPRALEESLASLPAGVADLDRMLYLECRHFLADHNLAYTDKMSMAAGVETRVPLLDPDVVALAFGLSAGLKQRGAEGKWVLKRAMEPLLPRELVYRPKTGFGVPLRAWLRGPLRELLADTLSEDRLRLRGLFDPVAVRRLIALDRTGRIDGAYSIFALLCIELWCRIFIDGEVPV